MGMTGLRDHDKVTMLRWLGSSGRGPDGQVRDEIRDETGGGVRDVLRTWPGRDGRTKDVADKHRYRRRPGDRGAQAAGRR